VQRNLVAQTGDPCGTGKGGESIYKKIYGDQAAYFEPETKPRIKHKTLGTVSMVNNGNSMHGSQFFITLSADIDYLDGQQHTVFGQVAEGFDILKHLNEAFVDTAFRPYKDIRIYHTVVLDDPFPDPPGLDLHIPDRSPEPPKLQADTVRIGVDEDIDDEKNWNQEKADERIREKEAHANAQILEMIGDLPSIDVKPPDNVLFVCKLNPVTTSEDLEVIFSRFGQIDSCEVIKDQKTNESLQYAFIEFKNVKDCESAYFKMDNILIDDRRIHIDFSQSVSKIKWKGNDKGVGNQKNENDDNKPQFRIKDPDLRVDESYDLVFDTDEPEKSRKKKVKKVKKHKKHRSMSREPKDSQIRPGKTSQRHSRSRSPGRKKIERKPSRSKSPYPKKTERKRSREKSPRTKRTEGQHSRSNSPRTKKTERQHSRSKSPRTKKTERQHSRSRSPCTKKTERQHSRSRSLRTKKTERQRSRSKSPCVKRTERQKSRSRSLVSSTKPIHKDKHQREDDQGKRRHETRDESDKKYDHKKSSGDKQSKKS